MHEPANGGVRPWAVRVYALKLAGTVVAFLAIRAVGETLTAPAPDPSAPVGGRGGAHGDALFHVLLALAAVIALGRLLGGLFRWVGQPPVIGEVVAGILLGP